MPTKIIKKIKAKGGAYARIGEKIKKHKPTNGIVKSTYGKEHSCGFAPRRLTKIPRINLFLKVSDMSLGSGLLTLFLNFVFLRPM
ncbi:hypothetical protein KW506_14940 [Vibrio fluvialis]|nr:hypothetical protein [Vibrio fluvialis]